MTDNQHIPSNDEENDGNEATSMGYQQTLMYGRYSRSLGEYAKEEASRQRMVEAQRRRDTKKRLRELSGKKQRGRTYRAFAKIVAYTWRHTFARIGEDWVFLALLGIFMAILSYIMDEGIDRCNAARRILYEEISDENLLLKYVAWVSLPVFLVLFSAGFVHVVAPQAIGSGIPEMKTILRGVVLKEYLTVKTLVAKVVGLTATLGSGMPLGKEGPFVHIASIVATLLTSMVTKFQGIYTNESRQSEMLAAACAVGVACCFGSPIGGVLFSIEVTSVFFAVRNYWRGFFAAICGATVFRLLDVWSGKSETMIAVFRTEFDVEFPYDIKELVIFAGIGIVSGVGGALYVYSHRRYVLWMRGNKSLTKFLQRNRFIYPFLVSLLISTLSFPPWLGKYHAATLGTHDQILTLFSNHTWIDNSTDDNYRFTHEYRMVQHHWVTRNTGVFVHMAIFMLLTFCTSIVAATLPVPTGVLIPAFKIGAAFGRLLGESVFLFAPSSSHNIVSGGYAIAGAAAFTGAVTHTISISVIVFEMTGQITHLFPVLISVLLSNAIASLLQPSCYDSIIMIKKLPYLPDILPSSSSAYHVYVEDFMLRDVKYIWYGITYRELREVLKGGMKLRSFPLVDNPRQMILLGSIQRSELINAIEQLIGKDRRIEVALNRQQVEIEMEEQRMATEERNKQQQQQQLRLVEEQRMAAEKKKQQQQLRLVEEQEQAERGRVGSSPQVQRRPSRFEVVSVSTAVDKKLVRSIASIEIPEEEVITTDSKTPKRRPSLDSLPAEYPLPAAKALPMLGEKPKKSILKKNNAYTIHAIDSSRPRLPMVPPPSTSSREGTLNSASREHIEPSYRTVTGAESIWRSALDNFQSIFKRPSSMNLDKSGEKNGSSFDQFLYAPGAEGRKVGYRMDMTLEEQREWEEQEMLKEVDFNKCHIDPAPFQLVEKSSLLKVHSMFSMLAVNRAYVTAIGRLIGVVGLKELRSGIENANSGHISKDSSAAVPRTVDDSPGPEQAVGPNEDDVEEEELNVIAESGCELVKSQ